MTMRKLKKYVPTKFKSKKSVYDRDAADYAVNFIQAHCHTKGTWAGKPFELIDWQEQIIRDCKLSSSEISFSFFDRSVFYFEQII